MTKTEMVDLVKKNLKIEDNSRDLSISDVINNVVIYCNLNEKHIPDQLEPFIRKKVSNMISYEDTNGYGLLHELNIPSFMAVRTVKK